MLGEVEDLQAIADSWPRTAATPDDVERMLAMGRPAFVHMWFVYELGPLAITWSLTTLEAALRARFQVTGKATLAGLVDRAHDAGWWSPDAAVAAHNVREARNHFAHGRISGVLGPASVEGALATVHRLVAELFPDDGAGVEDSLG